MKVLIKLIRTKEYYVAPNEGVTSHMKEAYVYDCDADKAFVQQAITGDNVRLVVVNGGGG